MSLVFWVPWAFIWLWHCIFPRNCQILQILHYTDICIFCLKGLENLDHSPQFCQYKFPLFYISQPFLHKSPPKRCNATGNGTVWINREENWTQCKGWNVAARFHIKSYLEKWLLATHKNPWLQFWRDEIRILKRVLNWEFYIYIYSKQSFAIFQLHYLTFIVASLCPSPNLFYVNHYVILSIKQKEIVCI